MRRAALLSLAVSAAALAGCQGWREPPTAMLNLSVADSAPAVRRYLVPERQGPIVVDGQLDEPAWETAPWSEPFVDIEGGNRPAPRLATRVRMLMDDSTWYIGARLEEPDLWATITVRDSVIYHDDDFELFVDPDGDTHRYFELEINALGTVWDLFLPRPYRDGGKARNDWTMEGLRAAVGLEGTLNDPSDRDRGWTVELAIPWAAFRDGDLTVLAPRAGDRWRVNFSRVEWTLDTAGGTYRKRPDPATGRPLAESNWVWSPQGAVAMHLPEMWGVVQFGGSWPAGPDSVRLVREEERRWLLRRVYHAQRVQLQKVGAFAPPAAFPGISGVPGDLVMRLDAEGYLACVPAAAEPGWWCIRQDGRIWREESAP